MARLYTECVNIPQQIQDLAKAIREQSPSLFIVGGLVEEHIVEAAQTTPICYHKNAGRIDNKPFVAHQVSR